MRYENDHEWWLDKDFEWDSHGLFLGTNPTVVQKKEKCQSGYNETRYLSV
jgi:hypothetical protein